MSSSGMDKLIYNRIAMRMNGILPNATMCESHKHNTERKKPYSRVYPVCFLLHNVSKLAKLVRKVVTFGKTKVMTERAWEGFCLARNVQFLGLSSNCTV